MGVRTVAKSQESNKNIKKWRDSETEDFDKERKLTAKKIKQETIVQGLCLNEWLETRKMVL